LGVLLLFWVPPSKRRALSELEGAGKEVTANTPKASVGVA
jgi:hypothetical protein